MDHRLEVPLAAARLDDCRRICTRGARWPRSPSYTSTNHSCQETFTRLHATHPFCARQKYAKCVHYLDAISRKCEAMQIAASNQCDPVRVVGKLHTRVHLMRVSPITGFTCFGVNFSPQLTIFVVAPGKHAAHSKLLVVLDRAFVSCRVTACKHKC